MVLYTFRVVTVRGWGGGGGKYYFGEFLRVTKLKVTLLTVIIGNLQYYRNVLNIITYSKIGVILLPICIIFRVSYAKLHREVIIRSRQFALN